MLRAIPLLLLLAFGSWHARAQDKAEEAKTNIQQLKQSFILVRLQTNQKKIDLLKESGREKMAQQAASEQYQENRETILSFQKTFDFCPVYFFYAPHSEAIRKGELAGVVFDYDQNEVPLEKLTTRPFFTAEFSETEKLGISALVLMDQYMVPLEDPFPYYERKYVFFSLIKQSKARMAELYNTKLKNYYERHH